MLVGSKQKEEQHVALQTVPLRTRVDGQPAVQVNDMALFTTSMLRHRAKPQLQLGTQAGLDTIQAARCRASIPRLSALHMPGQAASLIQRLVECQRQGSVTLLAAGSAARLQWLPSNSLTSSRILAPQASPCPSVPSQAATLAVGPPHSGLSLKPSGAPRQGDGPASTCARRPRKQHSQGGACAQAVELLGVLQELDHLHDLPLNLLQACDVLEGGVRPQPPDGASVQPVQGTAVKDWAGRAGRCSKLRGKEALCRVRGTRWLREVVQGWDSNTMLRAQRPGCSRPAEAASSLAGEPEFGHMGLRRCRSRVQH